MRVSCSFVLDWWQCIVLEQAQGAIGGESLGVTLAPRSMVRVRVKVRVRFPLRLGLA